MTVFGNYYLLPLNSEIHAYVDVHRDLGGNNPFAKIKELDGINSCGKSIL